MVNSSENADEFLLDHAEDPHHAERLPNPSCTHTVRNPVCGDEVTLELRINSSGILESAYFQSRGCLICRAAASILCEHIECRSLAELQNLQAADLLKLLGVPLTPRRQRCALLAFEALKTLVYSWNKNAT